MLTDQEVGVLFNQLKAALAARDRAGCNTVVFALLAARPRLGRHWKSLAAIAQQNGEVEAANRAMACHVEEAHDEPMARYAQAAVLAQTGRITEAEAIMAALPNQVPSEAENAYIRGTLASDMGNFTNARAQYRRSLQANERAGQVWLALAMTGQIEDFDWAAMKRLCDGEPFPDPGDHGALLYSVAKGWLEHDRPDAAFAALEQGAEVMRSIRPYDAAGDEAHAEES